MRWRARTTLCLLVGIFWLVDCRADAAEIREFLIGPAHLKAKQMARDELPRVDMPVEFSSNVWITKIESEVVDAKGTPLPRQLLCHNNLFAGQWSGGYPSLAWVPESSPVSFPSDTGFPLQGGTPYRWMSIFQNPFDEAYGDVFLRIRITLEPRDTASKRRRMLDLVMFCVKECSHEGYAVPPGRSVDRSPVSFGQAGTVMLMLPHIHRYGTRLTFERASLAEEGTSKVIFEVKPNETNMGAGGVPIWRSDAGLHVTPEEQFLLVAEYDNPTTAPWPAMGMLFIFMVPD